MGAVDRRVDIVHTSLVWVAQSVAHVEDVNHRGFKPVKDRRFVPKHLDSTRDFTLHQIRKLHGFIAGRRQQGGELGQDARRGLRARAPGRGRGRHVRAEQAGHEGGQLLLLLLLLLTLTAANVTTAAATANI